MAREKQSSSDSSKTADEQNHVRGVAEDVRVSEEGRGPGYSAKRVRYSDDAPRFHVNAEETENSKDDESGEAK